MESQKWWSRAFLSLSLLLPSSPLTDTPAALVPLGEPAGEKFLLLRINGIVCLALTRRSYRDRQTIFFLLEITREARLGWPGRQRLRGLRNRVAGRLRGGGRACAPEIRADLSTQGTTGRSRPGGSGEPLKCKRKERVERRRRGVEEEIVGMK